VTRNPRPNEEVIPLNPNMDQPPEHKVILVVTAHPDDSEFSAAGTIGRWAAEGHDVYYLICTNGNKGSGDPTMTSERLAPIRAAEQEAAARVLGVKKVHFLGYPDGGLEDTAEARGKIVRFIRMIKPDIVLSTEPYRLTHQHRDHRMAGTLALDACYPYARDHLSYPEQLEDGLEPHKVGEIYLAGSDKPDTWVDISATVEKKIEALRCHKSQVGNRPADEFAEGIRQRTAEVGKPHGMAHAEAFRRIEMRR